MPSQHDPYQLVKNEVESSLQSATTLLSSYKRIKATLASASSAPLAAHGGESEELHWSRDELNATLTALEGDVEELEMSVDIVERDPRFGVSSKEVEERRMFVQRVRDEIKSMRRTAAPSSASSKRHSASRPHSTAYRDNDEAYPPDAGGLGTDLDEEGEDSDLNRLYARQQQSLLLESQDHILDGISSTVTTLKNQAGVMGREMLDQVGLLDDLEGQVEGSQSRLDRASRRMEEFVRKNKNSKSSWTIFFLTIILSILLFLIIVV